MIKEQDLNLALLRASLGTAAQNDPCLLRLKFQLPSGPVRPLLPSFTGINLKSFLSCNGDFDKPTVFDDLLLGTSLTMTYDMTWPLDLFLHQSDLQVYSILFGYLSSIRKTQIRVHGCWSSLSNAQRARRRWTGLGEGGTTEDLEVRKHLLRRGWSVVRDMGWFLDVLLEYIMVDVVDPEFGRLKNRIANPLCGQTGNTQRDGASLFPDKTPTSTNPPLDFTTLRNFHTTYLERLITGCLLPQPALTAILRSILETCDQFAAQIERWGGDVLPALLFEGSLAGGGEEKVGAMVQERLQVVSGINKVNSFSCFLMESTQTSPRVCAFSSIRSINSYLL